VSFDDVATCSPGYGYIAAINGIANTLTTTIYPATTTFDSPASISVEGNYIYVANTGLNDFGCAPADDYVSVISTTSNSVVGTVTVDYGPIDAAISPNGQFLYTPNSVGNDVSVIQISSPTLVSCPQVSNKGGQNLQKANLAGCNLAGYNLQGDNLQNAILTDANLIGANLQGANLQNAVLFGATLTGANLAGANLQTAILTLANLNGVNLQGANLQNANLGFATLGSANLQGANLQNANLADAILVGTPAAKTNFNGANMQNADLASAVFGSPNYITAAGANTQNIDLVGSTGVCNPPL